jgi:hypothetical protein
MESRERKIVLPALAEEPQPIRKIKMPQNQVISELDNVNTMVAKTREKIRFLEYQCDKLKKRVQQRKLTMYHS